MIHYVKNHTSIESGVPERRTSGRVEKQTGIAGQAAHWQAAILETCCISVNGEEGGRKSAVVSAE